MATYVRIVDDWNASGNSSFNFITGVTADIKQNHVLDVVCGHGCTGIEVFSSDGPVEG